ncbi:MAG: hypothetical protein VYE73_06540 [Acidobacteriota bacterium]|nr:hypothetical protein [Acidobacteriota bacterium]
MCHSLDLQVVPDRVGFNHFGVVVDDLDEAKRRLAELGATVHFEPD